MSAKSSSLADRIVAVDLARALALFGMFAAHLITPVDAGGPGGVDLTFQVVAGRSSALFAVLAGVGIALSTRRAEQDPRAHRTRLVVRALLIALLGLWLGHFNSGLAVILTFYGLLFACALPVLTWRARPLALLAVAWGVLSPVVSLLMRRELSPSPKIVPSFLSLAEPVTLLQELFVTGYYPVLTWATYLFAGMAIGRVDLRRSLTGPRLALAGAWATALTLAVSSWVSSMPSARSALLADPHSPAGSWAALTTQLRRGLHGTHPEHSWWWLGVWSPHSGSIVDLAHTVGTSMLVLGLALWVVRLVPAAPWRILAGAGAMTLTLYTVHVLVVASPLGLRGGTMLLVHSLAAAGIGAMFAAIPARGPLEAAVRAATLLVPLGRR
ncbi:MAG: heparan-alpha-glucosaminide N-acetyltransferase domain-containing protein [Ornithinimicrobium sp.]|uniref:heparan-alpha-glucosaminide N-acetyltransferase domain-containing protein n=1 Tax=Ornithinimicrobium sp. TaxID=1977084 RepID=UPI0026E018C7|nr:heparan-alpha-glucosaminide N-acetyltransferase domain-containing protein [Ornithinimicrobium sp.]MDO5740843.1 heparan-alpha-glucosaminide N-acetyltransferase domain-containing protein [Ornithinimicrobium sp.]